MQHFFAEWGFALNLLLGYLHCRRQGQLLLKSSASQGCPQSILLLSLSLSQPHTDFQSHYLWMGSKLQPTFTAAIILSCPMYSFSYCELFNTWTSCFVRSRAKKAWFLCICAQCTLHPSYQNLQLLQPNSLPWNSTQCKYPYFPLHSQWPPPDLIFLLWLFSPILVISAGEKASFLEKEVKLCNPETL